LPRRPVAHWRSKYRLLTAGGHPLTPIDSWQLHPPAEPATSPVTPRRSHPKKQQGSQRLVLRARGHVPRNGQMVKERFRFRRSHRVRMTNTMKANVSFGPVDVALLRTVGKMLGAGDMTDPVRIWSRSFMGRSFRQLALKSHIRRTKHMHRRKRRFVRLTCECTVVQNVKSSGFSFFVDMRSAAGIIKKVSVESIVSHELCIRQRETKYE